MYFNVFELKINAGFGDLPKFVVKVREKAQLVFLKFFDDECMSSSDEDVKVIFCGCTSGALI